MTDPYELVAVARGWQHHTGKDFAHAIHSAATVEDLGLDPSKLETMVLAAIAYLQPVRELGSLLGREVSRDMLADIPSLGLIANCLKSPRARVPNTYVTTVEFPRRFGLNSLQDSPDRETIESAEIVPLAAVEGRNSKGHVGIGTEALQDQETFESAEF